MKFQTRNPAKQPSPYRGILVAAVFVGLLIIIAAAGNLLPEWIVGPAEKQKERPTEPQVNAPLPPEPNPQSSGEAAKERQGLPWYLTDPSVLKQTAESDTLDSHPFAHLLYQVTRADPAELAKQARPAPPPAETADLEAGACLSLEGTVRFQLPRGDLNNPAVGISEPVLYEIEAAGKHLYLVVGAYGTLGVEEGDTVKVLGRYYRQHRYVPHGEDSEDKVTKVPVIITRAVDGSRYRTDTSSLERVVDGTFAHEPRPFYHLAHVVRELGQAELKSRADATLTAKALMDAPAAARGKVVAIQGVLLASEMHEKPPNIAGLDRLYWSVIRSRSRHALWVYTLEEPKDLKKNDVVKVYGAFLKARRYTDQNKIERQALLIVARRLVKVEFKGRSYLSVLVLGIGALTLVALVVAVIIEQRRSRKVGDHVRQLSTRTRPKDLNARARAIASRTRKERKAPAAGDPEQGSPGPDDVG